MFHKEVASPFQSNNHAMLLAMIAFAYHSNASTVDVALDASVPCGCLCFDVSVFSGSVFLPISKTSLIPSRCLRTPPSTSSSGEREREERRVGIFNSRHVFIMGKCARVVSALKLITSSTLLYAEASFIQPIHLRLVL